MTRPASSDTSDPLELYDELVMDGRAPPPDEFARRFPEHPDLLTRIEALEALRAELDGAAGDLTTPEQKWPSRVGEFVLGERLGMGGMGVVFRARHETTGAAAAVKLLRSKSALALERFRRETSVLASIDHSAIPKIIAFGTDGDQAYTATELLSGSTLAELIDAAYGMKPIASRDPLRAPPKNLLPMTIRGATAVALDVAEALSHTHAHGIVHRDIKPENVMITDDGVTKLIDFGLAVAFESSNRVTKTGAFLGSPQYAAPEQLRGEKSSIGPWTDVYALGATLFELFTHRTPFGSSSAAREAAFTSARPPDGPRHYNTDVPWRLNRLVMKALAPNPRRRHPSGAELAAALKRWV